MTGLLDLATANCHAFSPPRKITSAKSPVNVKLVGDFLANPKWFCRLLVWVSNRQVKHKVDFTFIYEKVRHLYKPGGQPAEPVVLVKMWLIGYMYGIPSERRLEQEVNMNLAYRWLLGIPLDERVPRPQEVSYASRAAQFCLSIHKWRLCSAKESGSRSLFGDPVM